MASTIESRIAEAERSFDAQVRAYLGAVWEHRDTAVVLGSDDVPPGVERIYREGMRSWFRDRLSVHDIDHSADGQLLARVIIALLTESAAMLAMLMSRDTQAGAAPVIEAALAVISRAHRLTTCASQGRLAAGTEFIADGVVGNVCCTLDREDAHEYTTHR